MKGIKRVIIVLSLFGLTWWGLQVSGVSHSVAIKKSLSTFPDQLGTYFLSDTYRSSAAVVELLGVDDYIQYNYHQRTGHNINLYVGYYGAVGVDGAYHSPKNCMPGSGWGIDTIEEISIPFKSATDKKVNVTQMIIRHGAQQQLVLYWFQNRGRIIASEYWEKVYLIFDALTKQRRDGTFVRIITSTSKESFDKDQLETVAFAEIVMAELEGYLPGAEL